MPGERLAVLDNRRARHPRLQAVPAREALSECAAHVRGAVEARGVGRNDDDDLVQAEWPGRGEQLAARQPAEQPAKRLLGAGMVKLSRWTRRRLRDLENAAVEAYLRCRR